MAVLENEEAKHVQRILACSNCDQYLRKFAIGRFTIGQLCIHFSKKYFNVYEHVTILRKAGLIEKVEVGDTRRILFSITPKGKLALIEKGDING